MAVLKPMESVMKVADVMTLGAATVNVGSSASEAAQIMLQHQISGLPVVDDQGTLVGIVTERDFLRRMETGTDNRRLRWSELLFSVGAVAEDYIRSHSRKIEDIMTRDVVTVSNETPLSEAVDLMERHNVKRLPVLRDGKVLGMLSRANFLRAVARWEKGEADISLSDQIIRDQILNELQNQKWAPTVAVNIFVKNGIVELRGTVVDVRLRDAIRVIAESIPSVKEVKNNIDVIMPIPGLL